MRSRAVLGAVLLLLAPGAHAAEPEEAEGEARQYEIRIVQGASRADVERLTSGPTGVRQSSRSSRSGPQSTSLRVLPGRRASIETGRIVQAVDAVFVSRFGWGFGVERSERPVVRGFSVTATPRGDRVELELEAAIAREGRDQPENRQVQALRTSLLVREGEWTVVGGGSEPRPRAGKTYGTGARLEESSVLIRVDRVP